jgi:hypothetical protein
LCRHVGRCEKEFDELAMDGSNYLTWAIDIKIKLDSMCLDHVIAQPKAGNDERTEPDKSKGVALPATPFTPRPEV